MCAESHVARLHAREPCLGHSAAQSPQRSLRAALHDSAGVVGESEFVEVDWLGEELALLFLQRSGEHMAYWKLPGLTSSCGGGAGNTWPTGGLLEEG